MLSSTGNKARTVDYHRLPVILLCSLLIKSLFCKIGPKLDAPSRNRPWENQFPVILAQIGPSVGRG